MRVMLDLRPPHLVQSQEQQVDIVRLLSLLLFVIFILLSVFNIGNTALKLREVRAEIALLQGEEASVTDNNMRLAESIGKMRVLRDRVKGYLAFTRQELPTVEFMAALEGAVPQGLKISTLEIRPGNVLMRGSSLNDQNIIDFGEKLDSMKNIVRKVDAPVTTKGTLGARMISDFTITCNTKSISDIAAAYPAASESSNEGEASE